MHKKCRGQMEATLKLKPGVIPVVEKCIIHSEALLVEPLLPPSPPVLLYPPPPPL